MRLKEELMLPNQQATAADNEYGMTSFHTVYQWDGDNKGRLGQSTAADRSTFIFTDAAPVVFDKWSKKWVVSMCSGSHPFYLLDLI